MKQNFKGWNTVFGFTFRQTTNKARYKLVTILISILLFAACIIINLIASKPDDKPDSIDASPIQHVYILDESTLNITGLKDYNPELSSEIYGEIQYTEVTDQSRKEVLQTAANHGTESIAAFFGQDDTGYTLELAIPQDSTITQSDAWDLIEPLRLAFETFKLTQSKLSQEQLAYILTPTISSYTEVGENTSITAVLIRILAPMAFGLILYTMFILYGQNISQSVSTEKTSKLMDTLLTSIHPYGLITGKVLAITCSGVLQFTSWVAAIVLGLLSSNIIAGSIYPETPNTLSIALTFLRDNIGETALSMPSAILALIILCIGFLFFCTLAGVSGSLVAKPEDVATAQSLFTFPIIISFFVCYLGAAAENEALMNIVRYIPFTVPFSAPIDLLTGAMTLWQGIISLVILLVFTLLFIMFSAKLYKGMVLYTGQSVNLKLIMNIVRAKQ